MLAWAASEHQPREYQRDDGEDQMHRAATSVALNLAEGARHRTGNRGKHFDIAHGSAYEVKAALDVAQRWGWIDDAIAARTILDRLLRLLWGLTHARRA